MLKRIFETIIANVQLVSHGNVHRRRLDLRPVKYLEQHNTGVIHEFIRMPRIMDGIRADFYRRARLMNIYLAIRQR